MSLTVESSIVSEVFIKEEPNEDEEITSTEVKTANNTENQLLSQMLITEEPNQESIYSGANVETEENIGSLSSFCKAQPFTESSGEVIYEDSQIFIKVEKGDEFAKNFSLMLGGQEELTGGRRKRKATKSPVVRAQRRRKSVKESLPESQSLLSLKPLSSLLKQKSGESEFCYVCIDDILDGSSFKEHFDQMHQNSALCFVCGAASSSFTLLLNHLNAHPLSCTECNESFTCRKDTLLHHKHFHPSAAYHSISNFESSSQTIVKSSSKVPKKPTAAQEAIVLSNPYALIKQKPSCQNSKLKHVCAICMKGFRTRQHLRRHEFTHREKPQICKQCCLSFDSLNELKDHRIKIHAGNMAWICEVCGLAYEKYLSYREHVKKIHFGEKKVYQCELCQKVLSNHMIYKTHLRTHSGEKPFKCSICGKAYHDKYSMIKHEKLHKTQFVYKCSLCDKSYNRSCLLSEHIKWSHATTVEAELNNYKCGVCHMELGNADCYWQHVYNHSSQDISKMLTHNS